jgi:lipid-A-disaccharide synthase
MKLFLSAGEASGDAYAARILDLLGNPDSVGLGASRSKKAGMTLLADTSRWGVMSILQSLKVFPRIFPGYYKAKKYLDRNEGFFIPIDFGYVNIRLARHAKRRGWTVLYFVPPGSWRRDKQGRDLPAITDAVVTPFQYSAEMLNAMGARAFWFGHPIKELLRATKTSVTRGETIAILPGSRHHEIVENLGPIAEATRGLGKLEFGLPIDFDVNWIRSLWKGDQATFTVGDTHNVLRRAKAGIVCSGTATLEAALLRCPHVVMYRMPKSSIIEAKLIGFKLPKFISLPNIILDRPVLPELIQMFATPEAIRNELLGVLANPGPQLAAFEELDQALGPEDAITKTAGLIRQMMEAAPSHQLDTAQKIVGPLPKVGG